jgi:hypothetical protein
MVIGVALGSLAGCGDQEGGVRGECLVQFLPGVDGAQPPAPRPLPGATVQVRPAKGGAAVSQVRTDETGKFRIVLGPGEYLLEVQPPAGRQGIESQEAKPVTVSRGKFTEVTITLFMRGA